MSNAAAQQSGYITSGEAQLYTSFMPAARPAAGAVLMLAPTGEERKCAYRLLYECGLQLQAGLDVMRFDYTGAGESTGDPAAVDLGTYRRDAEAAWSALDALSDADAVWLLGARLGANLAVRLAADRPVAGVMLWEPLLRGEAYLDELIRRKQIKEMMGGGRADTADEALDACWDRGEPVDFDGFPMGPAMAADLRALDLRRELSAVAPGRPLLLVHVTAARKLQGAWSRLAADLGNREGAKFVTLRQKPFWGLLDYQEAKELKDETRTFCLPAT